MMFIYCPCKHRKETVKCGVSTTPDERILVCDEECAKIKRRFEFDKFAGAVLYQYYHIYRRRKEMFHPILITIQKKC